MEVDRTVLFAVGGVVLGVAIGYAVSSSGRAELEAQLRQQGDLAAAVSALEARLDGVETSVQDGVAGLAARVEALGAGAEAGDGIEGGLAEIVGRIEGLGSEIGGRLEAVAPQVREAVTREMEALHERVAAVAGAVAGAAGGAAPTETAAAPAPDPAAATGEGVEIGVGATAVLADGAVRVFLSRVDAEAETAEVAVNGLARTLLALGGTTEAEDCTVTLTGLAPGRATVDAVCGGAAAAPGAEAAAAEPAAAAGAGGLGDGSALAIGQTAVFGEGAARVFLSAVDAAAGAARLSINGAAPEALAVGASAAAGACTVTLTGIEGRRASVAGVCGEDAEAAAAEAAAPAAAEAAGSAAAAGSGEGSAIAVGQTAVLGDGALRVFLSSFDAEAGTARVAVNGTTLVTLAMAEPMEVEGCTVVLTGGEGREAIVDGGC